MHNLDPNDKLKQFQTSNQHAYIMGNLTNNQELLSNPLIRNVGSSLIKTNNYGKFNIHNDVKIIF